jgi:hypothetical protein
MARKKLKPYEAYPFDMFFGKPIAKMNDERRLFGIIGHHLCPIRMQAIARRRLIELGHIVRYAGKWIAKRELRNIERDKVKERGNAHYFEEGQRVKVHVVKELLYQGQGQYGTFFIYRFVDQDTGDVYHYKGGEPMRFEQAIILGTVSHEEYKGNKQTNLKRITVKLMRR